MNDTPRDAVVGGAKIASVWAFVGISSWADFAAMMAALYSLLMILNFCWDKFLKGWCIRAGWIKPKFNRRKADRR
jgi:pyrroloquinoline quinone (PQQ) biosynthesis protein C